MNLKYYDPLYLFLCRTRALRERDCAALEELRKAACSVHGDTRLVAEFFLRELGPTGECSPAAECQEAA